MNIRTLLIILTLSTQANIRGTIKLSLSGNDSHKFSIASHLKRRPIGVHSQNTAYLRVSCKRIDKIRENYLHSCSIKPKSSAPEGTFAVFKKNIKNNLQSLFHVTLTP